MPRKRIPLNELKGFKGINPDRALSEMVELLSSVPNLAIAEKYFADRAQYFILYRWLVETLYEDQVSERKPPDHLVNAQHALCNALHDLSFNIHPDFFLASRQKGKRHMHPLVQEGALCAAAYWNYEFVKGRQEGADSWWNSIIRKSPFKLPSSLAKHVSNIEQEDRDNRKALLLSYYSGFIDVSPKEAEDHAKLLKQLAELVLSTAGKT